MSPLLFILSRTLKNTVKGLKKKPGAMAAYIVLGVFVLFFIMMSIFMPSGSVAKRPPELFGAVVASTILTLLYLGIRQGLSNGRSFFRMADVNLVFSAPISPKKVMLYGFLRQLLVTLLFLVFASFQIPNLRNQFVLKPFALPILYAGILMLFLSMQLFSMLVYSLGSKTGSIRKLLQRILDALMFAVFAGLAYELYHTRDLYTAAQSYFQRPLFDWIPIAGSLKNFFMAAVQGVDSTFYLQSSLLFSQLGLLVYIIYAIRTDYYEDVLEATEKMETLIAAKQQGRIDLVQRHAKVRKIRGRLGSTGARALFSKHLLEHRKSGFFFLNKFSIIIIGIGISSKFFFPDATMQTTLLFSIYLQFLLSIQGRWPLELSKSFIYLIPARSIEKVFYATLTDILKSLLDGTLLFVAAGILFKAHPVTIALCILGYTSFGMVFTYGDVLGRRVFGETHSKHLQIFLRMFLMMLFVAPGLGVAMAFGILVNMTAFYLVLIAYNMLAAFVLLLLSKGLFETLELN